MGGASVLRASPTVGGAGWHRIARRRLRRADGGTAAMIVNPDVERYLSELGASEDPVLKDMERAAAERNFPIIGPLVGRLCWVLAQSIHARDVFEMGSGFGYSTYWFAHTVGDARRSAEARAYLEKAGMAQRVTFEVGEAREIITRYPGPFDVVFIDV